MTSLHTPPTSDGCGDLNILVERDRYLARTSGIEATVWNLDELLKAHA
ncbi:hypothetical protein NLX86_30750 [Streptomyces sp. A3M-1-3]|nr:hypothetical protein [Streptomyces sp. A3M-1-3]MCP3822306.1 hypothetical protein [Streptomyces sp. A3M-1-3]